VSATAAPRARKPAAPPSKADLAERDRYAKRTAESLDGVRASAQTWRTGLTAFITLVTTGVWSSPDVPPPPIWPPGGGPWSLS
jgi:hypothetical protein